MQTLSGCCNNLEFGGLSCKLKTQKFNNHRLSNKPGLKVENTSGTQEDVPNGQCPAHKGSGRIPRVENGKKKEKQLRAQGRRHTCGASPPIVGFPGDGV